jgi:hypothetical protein
MKNKNRIAFELKADLHEKLERLCKRSSRGYSEYLRGLIAEEHNRVFSQKKSVTVGSDTDTDIIEILKKIEINTRRSEKND